MRRPARILLLAALLLVAGGALLLALRPVAGGEPERRAGEEASPEAEPRDAFAERMAELRARAPEGFTIESAPPFIVLGDEPAATVRRRARDTVRWAVGLLKTEYFAKDPDEIIAIWLFKDRDSYQTHALELFGERPSTPFGYYSAANRALVMNISTGGGTLVHEIVHPFVRANFPACPTWFNEGLASLYEQCGERDGRIRGFTNWRLAGLKRTIRARRLRSFKELTATTTEEFYGEDSGTHYAQARYLCYYLQEKGLLRKFYRAFRERCEEDPTGYATLKEVLGEPDMDAFGERWRAYVLRLRFPL